MNTIQLSLELEPANLRRHAFMLTQLAEAMAAEIKQAEDAHVNVALDKVGEILKNALPVQPEIKYAAPAPGLYQDDVGTIPATEPGQPVGLIVPEPTAIFSAPVADDLGKAAVSQAVTAPAPTMSTSTISETAPTAELDADGLPWDERIHSSGKSRVKDGTWKLKRGLEQSYIDGVRAELRGVPAAPVAPAAPAAPTNVINDFPSLMRAVMAAGITNEQFTAAGVAYGIESPMLLATKPELIPNVAEHLGLK